LAASLSPAMRPRHYGEVSYYFVASSGSGELLLSVAFSELLLGGGLLVPPDGMLC